MEMEAYDAKASSEESEDEDVMNPVFFLTPEEPAFLLGNFSGNREPSNDGFSMFNFPPSDCRRASNDTAVFPEIETLQLQPSTERNQKIISFDRLEGKSPSNLRICSWNICGLRSNIQKGGFVYLKNENFDIIALQETRCPGDERPRKTQLPHYYVTFNDNELTEGTAEWPFTLKRNP